MLHLYVMLAYCIVLFAALHVVELVSKQEYTWGDWQQCVGEGAALACFGKCSGLVSEYRRDNVKKCLVMAAQKQTESFTACLISNGYDVRGSTKCFGTPREPSKQLVYRFKRSEESTIAAFGDCVTACLEPAINACQTCTPITYFDHPTIKMIFVNCNKWHAETGHKEIADNVWIACLKQIGYTNIQRAGCWACGASIIVIVMALMSATLIYAFY